MDTIGDCFGVSFLSAYAPTGDSKLRHLHDALCRSIADFRQASARAQQARGRPACARIQVTSRLQGDQGAHGWAPAGSRELWTDVPVVCPMLTSYIDAARNKRGAAAVSAGNH